MRYPAILAAALAATAFAVPAAADTVAVKYSDLDLSTPAGQASLERRINNAAKSICGADSTIVGSRIPTDDARQCMESAKSRVHAQVAEAISRDRGRG